MADTHVALWYLYGDARLSAVAKRFIDEAAAGRRKIAVSTISLIEVVYLVEKNRIPVSAYTDITGAFIDPNHVFVEAVLSEAVADAMRRVSRVEVPDMPDRIVAATGVHFGVPIVSRDSRISAASLTTIW